VLTHVTCSYTPTGIAKEIMGLGPNLARKTVLDFGNAIKWYE